jgi:hypothetical protein
MVHWFRDREGRHFRRDAGLFWGLSDRDGQEYAVSGDGFRLPQNCYMAANAKAIADFARIAGRADLEKEFSAKHTAIAGKIESLLWSEADRFYMNIHCPRQDGEADYAREDRRFKCRELWGYTPWRFGLAPAGREEAFDLLADPNCFYGAYGLTTAERNHPGYGCFYTGEELNAWLKARDQPDAGPEGHECLWNGPSWPFATSIALAALARSAQNGKGANQQDSPPAGAELFVKLLKQYAAGHRLNPGCPDSPFWIDEVMHPDTGDWIARTRLMRWDQSGWSKEKGGVERGKDYNHSTFCDSIISGLFGLGMENGKLSARPLLPKAWDHAGIYRVPGGGKLWDVEFRKDRITVIEE